MDDHILEIKNLTIAIEDSDKTILNNLSLSIPYQETHAIMGPNGAGKSTLANILSGREGYNILTGSILYKGQNLLEQEPEERARNGVFLSFQYPMELPGVVGLTFLRTAMNAQRKANKELEISAPEFIKKAKQIAVVLKMDFEMLKRPLNVGFSGGEKKRMEVFQMLMLSPDFAILDETDSGLDIDALKIVAQGMQELNKQGSSQLIITHYQRLLNYIKPDKVHVLVNGSIVETGEFELAQRLEKTGYDTYLSAA